VARKAHHEEHPDERWLITYADLLTLMFVLFMVLFSVASVNTTKFELLKKSLSEAFSLTNFGGGGAAVLPEKSSSQASPVASGFPTIAPTTSPQASSTLLDSTPAQAMESAQLDEAKRRIDAAATRAGLDGAIRTQVDRRGLAVRLMTDDVLFESGTATLSGAAPALLDPIAAALRGLPNPIRVEGHTDARPIATAAFPSNWELSGGRAGAVVRHLAGRGVPQGRIEMVGYADTRPVGPNDTDSGRRQNRRVDVLVERIQGEPGSGP
jgi:chemotaxis protein MotB